MNNYCLTNDEVIVTVAYPKFVKRFLSLTSFNFL